jgi:hypothetical protein
MDVSLSGPKLQYLSDPVSRSWISTGYRNKTVLVGFRTNVHSLSCFAMGHVLSMTHGIFLSSLFQHSAQVVPGQGVPEFGQVHSLDGQSAHLAPGPPRQGQRSTNHRVAVLRSQGNVVRFPRERDSSPPGNIQPFLNIVTLVLPQYTK